MPERLLLTPLLGARLLTAPPSFPDTTPAEDDADPERSEQGTEEKARAGTVGSTQERRTGDPAEQQGDEKSQERNGHR